MSVVVETHELTKTYWQGKVPVHALRGVDLSVRQGELIALLGPSGSGKSTLLNMIGAIDLPTSGQVIIEGKDIATLNKNRLAELRQHIGFVFQYLNLIPRLTAAENVELVLNIQGSLSRKARKERTRELLQLVGLGDRMKHKPTELSGGQQQRVAVARALAQNPTYFLMDEPTGNLDTKNRDNILSLIRDLNRNQHLTTILITHDPIVAQIAERVLYIVDGKLYQSELEAKEAQLQTITENMNNGGHVA